MTSRNRALLEKADIAVSDLISDGGYLQPEFARQFMRILIDEARLLKMVTFTPMKSPQRIIDETRFEGMILKPGVSGEALTEAQRSKPSLYKVQLDAKLFKAEVRIPDEVLEDNIEQGNFRQTIMQMMAEKVALDMEDVAVRGDTATAPPAGYEARQVLDGILKQATTNVVAKSPVAAISKQDLTDAIKTMPSEFLRNKKAMRLFTSIKAEVDYRNLLSERATTVGDKFLEQDAPVLFSGIPLIDVPVFPENLGTGTNETVILLTDPKNIWVGMHREIRIETDKDISAGEYIIVATLRWDVKFAFEPACVKVTGVTVD